MSSRPAHNDWLLPLSLYVATCITVTGFRADDTALFYQFCVSVFTFSMDSALSSNAWAVFWELLEHGILYTVPLMFLLTCHEFGHYLQSKRYGVDSSLPYFIPMPFGPIGTLGAVITMNDEIPHRRALFDIGISGPIAGLIPTFFFLYYGIKWSHYGPPSDDINELVFNEPLIFQMIAHWIFGPVPDSMILYKHPFAMAGWVGLLVTSLNLLPFNQLDGGHVFYALLGRRAGKFSLIIFYFVIGLVFLFQLWHWVLILTILTCVGVYHPPTADDSVSLTPFRYILGWATLIFVFIGITPTPISLDDPPIYRKSQWYCSISPDQCTTVASLLTADIADRSDVRCLTSPMSGQ